VPDGGWDADFPDEAGAIRSLAVYANELFPDRVVWQESDMLIAFEVREARPRIWVALDQWIVVEVGRRHWEIEYGDEGIQEAREVLLNASR
jgi:hypothetical protein